MLMRFLRIILLLCTVHAQSLYGQDIIDSTEFSFGGYVKADFIQTWYMNGDVPQGSSLRDFHLPKAIPVGMEAQYYHLDYHAKESRLNFDVTTRLLNMEIHGFVEMDFLLSTQGNQLVSNSFSPRLRHFFFEWENLLAGQTWTNFMVAVVPDDLDLTGAFEGLAFARQAQLKYTLKSWQFSIENPETTVNPYQEDILITTDKDIFPDFVARKNFTGDWGRWSIAGMYRTLGGADSLNNTNHKSGFGITTGGKIKIGKKGSDLRAVVTYGQGLGRYLGGGIIAGAVQDEESLLRLVESVNGFIAYNHFWKPERWASSFNVSALRAFNKGSYTHGLVNELAWSASANLKYTPVKQVMVGVEGMIASRETYDGTDGLFYRLQFGAKYWFGYKNLSVYERN